MATKDAMTIDFDQKACDMNPFCPAAKACPSGALHIDRKTYRPTFDSQRCTECGVCLSKCPRGAVADR